MSTTQTLTLEEIELPTLSYGEQSGSQTRQTSKEELGRVEPAEYRQFNVTAELPPMDKGFHAYAFLAGGFVVELLIWALPFTYGVFLNHYTSHHLFDGPQETLLPLVGTLSSGIIYLTSVFVMPLLARYPQHRQTMMWAGAVLCVVAMIGAAFSRLGILYSIGGTIVYFPMQMYVFEWFKERRGLANGLIFAGTGLGGVILPFVAEKLLINYGLRTTFMALAISYAILLTASLPFVKGRLPPSSLIIPQQHSDWSFLRNPEFLILFAGNFLQGLGNFVPGIWLPTTHAYCFCSRIWVPCRRILGSLDQICIKPGSGEHSNNCSPHVNFSGGTGSRKRTCGSNLYQPAPICIGQWKTCIRSQELRSVNHLHWRHVIREHNRDFLQKCWQVRTPSLTSCHADRRLAIENLCVYTVRYGRLSCEHPLYAELNVFGQVYWNNLRVLPV
ncbi:hypothetical protein RSAG8_05032, partial [Rhizoctonia solani AG-8 WAC10335]